MAFCRQLALSDPQDVVNDADGKHTQLHVLLNVPQRGQEPESVILHPEDVTSNRKTVALHHHSHHMQTQGLIFPLEQVSIYSNQLALHLCRGHDISQR